MRQFPIPEILVSQSRSRQGCRRTDGRVRWNFAPDLNRRLVEISRDSAQVLAIRLIVPP